MLSLDIPFHATAVHYPVGLLSTAALLYVLYAWTGREAFRTTGWYCHGLGLVGALVAVLSGVSARPDVASQVPTAWLDRHQTLGIGTGVYFLLMWLIFLQRPTWLRRRGMVTLLGTLGWGLLLATVWYGEAIVWRFLVRPAP